MTSSPYRSFLPPARRAAAGLEPESMRWSWRGHDVHIARARRPDAMARILVIHGAGGHSGALWPLAALLANEGLDIAAVDLPLYGTTTSPNPERVRYEDWVTLLVELVAAEDAADAHRRGSGGAARPLVLLGASIGGMLSLEVASRTPHVQAVVATCLLDPGDWRARARMTRFGNLGVAGRSLSALVRGPMASLRVPMSSIANLSKMSRDAGLSALCERDPLGGGARVPLGFLASYMRYRHAPPETISTPVTLVHPSHDSWTPVDLSMRVLRRLAGPTRTVMLRECGHFPIEEPGLEDLLNAVHDVARQFGGHS